MKSPVCWIIWKVHAGAVDYRRGAVHFCSGADLAMGGRATSATGGQNAYRSLTSGYNPLMMKMARLPIPIVTAVNGPAAGIGCSLALASDFAIAGKSAYFLQAFVNIGLVPDGGASWMLARLVGKAARYRNDAAR